VTLREVPEKQPGSCHPIQHGQAAAKQHRHGDCAADAPHPAVQFVDESHQLMHGLLVLVHEHVRNNGVAASNLDGRVCLQNVGSEARLALGLEALTYIAFERWTCMGPVLLYLPFK
jgi:hypothetical protein